MTAWYKQWLPWPKKENDATKQHQFEELSNKLDEKAEAVDDAEKKQQKSEETLNQADLSLTAVKDLSDEAQEELNQAITQHEAAIAVVKQAEEAVEGFKEKAKVALAVWENKKAERDKARQELDQRIADLEKLKRELDELAKERDSAAHKKMVQVMGYPAPSSGIEFIATDEIILFQKELINKLRNAVAIPDKDFESVVKPVIKEYANFVHLLPASQHNHHAGLGGLFRHGLEVALSATMASHNTIFCTGYDPVKARMAEPRWRVGTCIAGLLHDAGKPASDVIITTEKGGETWQPHKENLMTWRKRQKKQDKYYISWRDDRHKQHEKYSLYLLQRLIPQETMDWIYESSDGKYIFDAIMDAASEMKSPHIVTQLVKEADGRSTKKDRNRQYSNMSLDQINVPVERHILDAVRTLIRTKNWSCNQKGGRVWVFGDGFAHLAWRQAADEILEVLDRDDVHGIPRDVDTLADILIDKGIAEVKEDDEGGFKTRYWSMRPAILTLDNGKPVPLEMLRIKIGYVFDGEPPPKTNLWSDKKRAVQKPKAQKNDSDHDDAVVVEKPTKNNSIPTLQEEGEMPVADTVFGNIAEQKKAAVVQQQSSPQQLEVAAEEAEDVTEGQQVSKSDDNVDTEASNEKAVPDQAAEEHKNIAEVDSAQEIAIKKSSAYHAMMSDKTDSLYKKILNLAINNTDLFKEIIEATHSRYGIEYSSLEMIGDKRDVLDSMIERNYIFYSSKDENHLHQIAGKSYVLFKGRLLKHIKDILIIKCHENHDENEVNSNQNEQKEIIECDYKKPVAKNNQLEEIIDMVWTLRNHEKTVETEAGWVFDVNCLIQQIQNKTQGTDAYFVSSLVPKLHSQDGFSLGNKSNELILKKVA